MEFYRSQDVSSPDRYSIVYSELALVLIILWMLLILWSMSRRMLLEPLWCLILKQRLLILCYNDVREHIVRHERHECLVLRMNIRHHNTSLSLFLFVKVAFRLLRSDLIISSNIWNLACLYSESLCFFLLLLSIQVLFYFFLQVFICGNRSNVTLFCAV